MSYSIYTIPYFDRQLKRLVKKYPSLKKEFIDLSNSLKELPNQGSSLGNNCYKVRLSIVSKGKGKSGSSRVITYLRSTEAKIYFLSIYDKSEQSNISNAELLKLLNQVNA